jgi:hypothetical protein
MKNSKNNSLTNELGIHFHHVCICRQTSLGHDVNQLGKT